MRAIHGLQGVMRSAADCHAATAAMMPEVVGQPQFMRGAAGVAAARGQPGQCLTPQWLEKQQLQVVDRCAPAVLVQCGLAIRAGVAVAGHADTLLQKMHCGGAYMFVGTNSHQMHLSQNRNGNQRCRWRPEQMSTLAAPARYDVAP